MGEFVIPGDCAECGARPQERSRCPLCGEPQWILEHTGGHRQFGPNERVSACRCYMKDSRVNKPRVGHNGINYGYVSTPEMARKAALGIAAGRPIKHALLDAGYSENLAKRGKGGINRMIRAELKTLGRKYIEMGRDLSPEDQENLVRGQLMESVILKQDKGVAAAKQLGADKRVAMWQSESTANMIVLQAPIVKPVSHPVPLLPSKHPEDLE